MRLFCGIVLKRTKLSAVLNLELCAGHEKRALGDWLFIRNVFLFCILFGTSPQISMLATMENGHSRDTRVFVLDFESANTFTHDFSKDRRSPEVGG